jgi:hypothetical protein
MNLLCFCAVALLYLFCIVISSASTAQQMNVLLQQAKQYAYGLLSDWSLSRCGEAVMIFYSRRDSVVSVVHSVLE